MPYTEYDGSRWLAIRRFLDHRRPRILGAIKAHDPPESYNITHFIHLLETLSAEGDGEIRSLLSRENIEKFKRNKDLLKDYLAAAKRDAIMPVVGVPADGGIDRHLDVQAKFHLSQVTATAAANPNSLRSGRLRCDSSTQTFYHQTVHGPEGVRLTGGDPPTVSCFYREEGGKYYLVAWGVHVGKNLRSSVYRVKEAVDDCGLKAGAQLFS